MPPTVFSSGEPIPIGEQLMHVDQAITHTLQQIDANFAQTHQTITSRILPAIKQYGVESHNTWQGAKFWHRFFETASDIHLAPARAEDSIGEDISIQSDVQQAQTLDALRDEDLEVKSRDKRLQDESGELSETDFEPPRLSNASIAAATRLGRVDPDEALNAVDTPQDDAADKLASPSQRTVKTAFQSKRVTTPRAQAVERKDRNAASQRIGITDLRKTPLSTFKARSFPKSADKKAEENDDDTLEWPPGMSPPVTMQFSVPRSRYMKTPAKEAAHLVVEDLLRTVEGTSPATRRTLMQQRSGKEQGIHDHASSSKGLIGTPLRKPVSRKGRTSMPTPPTITKRVGSQVPTSGPSESTPATSSRLFDEDEEGGDLSFRESGVRGEDDIPADLGTGLSKVALGTSASSIDKLLDSSQLDDDDSDNDVDDSDEEDDDVGFSAGSVAKAPYQPTQHHIHDGFTSLTAASSSLSHSIDEDTLFGIQEPSRTRHSHVKTQLHDHKRNDATPLEQNVPQLQRASDHFRTKQAASATPSARDYQPMGQVQQLGTVFRGRPLVNEERDYTYSAPSPTPAGAQRTHPSR